jgi:hypothetical protein
MGTLSPRGLASRPVIPCSSLSYVVSVIGRPTHLLAASLPSLEDCRRSSSALRQGTAPVSGVIPVGVALHLLEIGLGNPAFAMSRGSPERLAPYAWARTPLCWHAIVPIHLSATGQPTDQRHTSNLSLLGRGCNRAPRGVVEATMRDPSRSVPRLISPKETSASAGNPTLLSRLRGVLETEICRRAWLPFRIR